jgi:hypothetical protein
VERIGGGNEKAPRAVRLAGLMEFLSASLLSEFSGERYCFEGLRWLSGDYRWFCGSAFRAGREVYKIRSGTEYIQGLAVCNNFFARCCCFSIGLPFWSRENLV